MPNQPTISLVCEPDGLDPTRRDVRGPRTRAAAGHELRLIAPGVVLGCVVGLGLSALVKSQLIGLERADPRIFAAAVVIEVAVALAAAWLPARRAGHTDPLSALRTN